MKIIKNKIFILSMIIFIIGICVRIIPLSIITPPIASDSGSYFNPAYSIADFKGYTDFKTNQPFTRRPPGYPLFLSFFFFIFQTKNLYAAYIAQSFIISLTGIAGFLFLYKNNLLNIVFSFLTGLYYVTEPILLPFSLVILKEALCSVIIFLILINLYYYLKKNQFKFLFFCSFFIGYLILILPQMVIFPYFMLFLIYFNLTKKYNLKKIITHLLMFLFICYLPVSIWIIRNKMVMKTVALEGANNSKLIWETTMWPGNKRWNEYTDEYKQLKAYHDKMIASRPENISLSKFYLIKAAENIRKNPIRTIFNILKTHSWSFLDVPGSVLYLKGIFLKMFYFYNYIRLLFFILGIYFSIKYRNIFFNIINVFLIYFIAIHLPFHCVPRYNVPIIFIICFYCALPLYYFFKNKQIIK